MRKQKSVLVFMFMLMAMLSSAQDIYRVTASTSLNVRSQPSTSSSIIGSLKRGDDIVSLNVDNDWVEFIWKDRLAYASSKYVQYISPVPQSDTLYMVAYEVQKGQFVDVRSLPSTASYLIGRLTDSEPVIPEKIEAGWACITYKERVGYVKIQNLRRVLYKKPIVKEPEPVLQEIVKEPEEIKDTVLVTEVQQNKKKFKDVAGNVVAFTKELVDSLPDYVVNVPKLQTEQCDLFLSARLGLGGTSFTWGDGPVYGIFSVALDAIAQFYVNEKMSFIPKGYYSEAALGYAMKGAASLPIHYLDLHLMPFGYYHDIKNLRLTGKLGVYSGFPLSDLDNAYPSTVDCGVSLGAMVEYRLLSAGLTFEHGFVPAIDSGVRLYNWGIMFQITCKILSFNKLSDEK